MAEAYPDSRRPPEDPGYRPGAEGAASQAGAGVRNGMSHVHGIASDGVHVLRDVASDTVRAAGEVGVVAVDATRSVLVGVADGVRDILAHIIPSTAAGRREPPPAAHRDDR